MQSPVEAYLDIETTGLSPAECMVTVVGIYVCNGDGDKVTQLVGKDIATHSILEALEGTSIIYTYNGSRFDLPFINSCLGINLIQIFPHHDLMYDCWKKNLYGGLKAVERQLGIERRLKDMNGYEAVRLWWKYIDSFDLEALNKLLEYNKEDVVNLKNLKERLLQLNTSPM
ncbi:ribonuclease H-like domain-containing protein [Chloroflexota bacterium]